MQIYIQDFQCVFKVDAVYCEIIMFGLSGLSKIGSGNKRKRKESNMSELIRVMCKVPQIISFNYINIHNIVIIFRIILIPTSTCLIPFTNLSSNNVLDFFVNWNALIGGQEFVERSRGGHLHNQHQILCTAQPQHADNEGIA